MSQVEAPNYLRKWEFGDSACYAELPKVAGAVIEAAGCLQETMEVANRWVSTKLRDELSSRGEP